MDKHLVIFAREPRYGAVKKRLARGIGRLEALRFYRRQLKKICRRLGGDSRWKSWLAVTPDPVRGKSNLFDSRFILLPQGRGDLGQRMIRFLTQRLPPGPVVLVGSDIPAIASQDIARAFQALGNHDVVFGPAPDGGYWLIGLKNLRPMPPDFLRMVRWSSPHALSDSRSGLAGRYSVACLGLLDDVDDAESYGRWRDSRRD